MTQPNPSTAAARTIVDELARGGVRLAVLSPGSRSAALVIAAEEHPDVETRVVLDERSAGFHALGHAKVAGEPAVAICTSGTAGANYYPAVIEAEMACTPLIILTADRPAELRGVGANQTIDQRHLFGAHVRRHVDVPAATSYEDGNELWRAAVAEVVAAARGSAAVPGPVHLNVAFREPTVPVSDDGRTTSPMYGYSIEGREERAPWVVSDVPRSQAAPLLLPPGAHGVVIAGDGAYDRKALTVVASALGWPVLATAESGVGGPGVIRRYHHILAREAGELAADVAVVVGSVGPSRRLEAMISRDTGSRFRIDAWGRRLDPTLDATEVISADPVATLAGSKSRPAPAAWVESWTGAEAVVDAAIRSVLETAPLSGPVVADALNSVYWDCLAVASSLPIRDVDAHLRRTGRVVANRGASGIDGFVGMALGAAGATRARTLAVAGDLSLLHDGNGFIAEDRPDLVMVVVDNGGGGLFDLLPPSRHAPRYERLFVTPHRRDLETLARFHRLEYVRIGSRAQLGTELESRLDRGLHLVHVPVDRGQDLEVRSRLDEVSRSAREP